MQEHFYHDCDNREVVAMAYVPWQNMKEIYDDLDMAMCFGTIFPELNKPFTGRRIK